MGCETIQLSRMTTHEVGGGDRADVGAPPGPDRGVCRAGQGVVAARATRVRGRRGARARRGRDRRTTERRTR
jgi:hypothetical protein